MNLSTWILSHGFSILRALWIHILLKLCSKLARWLKRSNCLYFGFYLIDWCLLSLIFYSKAFTLSYRFNYWQIFTYKKSIDWWKDTLLTFQENNWTNKIKFLKNIYSLFSSYWKNNMFWLQKGWKTWKKSTKDSSFRDKPC